MHKAFYGLRSSFLRSWTLIPTSKETYNVINGSSRESQTYNMGKEKFDVIVVGGGPAGSVSARTAAQH
ncbi:hypothetical protein HY230_10965, partial [Candidatus Acetothermia bacterium]|nr:hypothetical protein [Candidatus Acetothermia bacterium]